MYLSLAWKDGLGQGELTRASLVNYELLGFLVDLSSQRAQCCLANSSSRHG